MNRLSLIVPVLVLFSLASCGGGGGGGISGTPDQPKVVSVVIIEDNARLEVGDTFQFHASVSNASDSTLTWTVNDVVGGNSTVGTMSVDGLYTAPAAVPNPNPVTVKATSNQDKTKSDTATVTIDPKFTISPTSATVAVGQTQTFSASLGVDNWQVNGVVGGNSTVGTISTIGIYTAPATVPNPNTVTVKAVKIGDSSKTATATVKITPAAAKAPTVSPHSATVAAGGTQQFTADVDVTWSVEGAAGTDASTWGSISTSGLYTAPLGPPWTGNVNIKATSKADTTLSGYATATIVFSKATLSGHYVFRYRGADKSSGPSLPNRLWAIGSFVADGKGGITGGSMDLNLLTSGGSQSDTASITGTYSIGADGRGSGTLNFQANGGAQTIPMQLVMCSHTSARMIGFDDTGSGWGNIDLQDASSFAGGLAGTWVFSYDGLNNADYPVAGVGMFTAESGVVSSGLMDYNEQFTDPGTVLQNGSISGSYTTVDASTGRGTWNFVDGWAGYTHSFAFYLINSSSFVFSSTDLGFGELGVAVQQNTSAAFSNSSLTGNSVLLSNGYTSVSSNTVSATAAGLLTSDGSGNFTAGVIDANGNGNASTTGTYSISSNGHGTMTLQTGSASSTFGFYLTGAGQGFYISFSSAVVSSGQFLPQASGTYNTASLAGSLAFVVRASYTAAGKDLVGQMTSDGAGNLTGTVDMNNAGTLTPATAITGTCTVSSNGRGQVTTSAASSTTHYAIYLASGRLAFLVPIDSGSPGALGLIYRQF